MIRPLSADDLVRGQFRGYRKEVGVAPDSTVETFAAVRLHVDSWRWDGVPFFIRAGKCLAATTTEVLVTLRRPPLSKLCPHQTNYVRFRLSPEVTIAIGAREDGVEAAWAIVQTILGGTTLIHIYEPGSWGPDEAARLTAGVGGWHSP